jgi:uncharacterized protein YciI
LPCCTGQAQQSTTVRACSSTRGIGEHYAFLQRLAADGVLVAAGPLTDSDGEGMTVIEAGSVEDARQLAEQEDASVRAGVLSVTVRPWRVVLAPIAER